MRMVNGRRTLGAAGATETEAAGATETEATGATETEATGAAEAKGVAVVMTSFSGGLQHADHRLAQAVEETFGRARVLHHFAAVKGRAQGGGVGVLAA